AAGLQLQLDKLEWSGAGAPHQLLRFRDLERDRIVGERVSPIHHAVSPLAEWERARELGVRRWRQRRAVDRVWRDFGEQQHLVWGNRPHEPTLLVQREQQAPRQ